jgi:ElaB/YqjD/DUF883 family membrane-anchored ribosome-binding protein
MADYSSAVRNPKEATQQFSDKAQEFASQARGKASEAAETVRDTGNQAMRMAQEGYQQVRDRAVDYMEQGRERLRDAGETVQAQVQSHPLNSIMIACGFGFLLGVLWMRR